MLPKPALSIATVLLITGALAGCGGASGPVTVTSIPYGTVTVANENVGSVFLCESGIGLKIKDGEDAGVSGGIVARDTHKVIRVWQRGGRDLVSCTRQ